MTSANDFINLHREKTTTSQPSSQHLQRMYDYTYYFTLFAVILLHGLAMWLCDDDITAQPFVCQEYFRPLELLNCYPHVTAGSKGPA